ncbi:MAG: SWIM zinc finger family protein, partial [Lachnospiraceae bacterium]|nr:SWIM zinc finger family protein [Lachnospiraceae bacterium]
MNWKNLFAPHILDRGYDYYCEDAVKNLDVSGEIIRADVIGTQEYKVEISLNQGKIVDMDCTCPYADEGTYCKHMAAVLNEWSASGERSGDDNSAEQDLFATART